MSKNMINECLLMERPGFSSLVLEFNQLQQALLILQGELNKTGELISNLSHYLQESHFIQIPRNQKPCEIMIGEQNE